MNRVTTYDQLGALKAKLNQAATDGTLTPEQLGAAVDTIDEAGYECMPSSVGMDWICNNIVLFARFVPDSLSFWRTHMDNSYVETAIKHGELLQLIPADQREEFVIEVFERHGTARSFMAALDGGVSRQALANALLNKLRATQVTQDSTRTDFVTYEFMRYGAKSLWSILDDDEFWQSMQICVDKAPNYFFDKPDSLSGEAAMFKQLGQRLSDIQRANIFDLAASNLQTLDGVSLSELGRLHRSTRLTVAKRTGGSIELIVDLALEYGAHEGGLAILHQFQGLFLETTNAAYFFRTLWKKLSDSDERGVANRIKQLLTEQVQAAGYILGQVSIGTYYNRRAGRSLSQLQVIAGNTFYVQDRKQHRYTAKKGDWVLIDPKRTVQLTPRVKATIFIPAHHGGEY